MRALVITALGNAVRTQYTGLDDLQRAVGGYVEAIDVDVNGQDCTLWFNEEGKLLRLPVNGPCTGLAATRIMASDYIAGDVYITGGVDDEGETLEVPEEAEAFLLKLVRK